MNNLGYNIYKSKQEHTNYKKVNFSIIQGSGNSTSTHFYSFEDSKIENFNTYYYKIETVDYNGSSHFYGPISIFFESEIKKIPTSFELFQNFPNPFNPATQIKFSLPKENYIEIAVYNTLGSKLTTLLHEKLEPGFHSATWDGTDEFGNKMGSGIYIVKMVSGSFVDYRKMLLVK